MSNSKLTWIIKVLFCVASLTLSIHADDKIDRKIVDPEKGVHLRAILPTPVFSISEIPSIYYDYESFKPRIKTDDKGHIRELEFIALKDTKFHFKTSYKYGRIIVYEVTTEDYPSDKKLFIDSNFVVQCFDDHPERTKILPKKEDILTRLKGLVGTPYLWGGNYAPGIKQLANFYPVGNATEDIKFLNDNLEHWTLQGVDCSGMLYQVTEGFTPRNTSDLTNYGQAVDIEGLSVDEIIPKLRPLDLIVWNGHMLVVYDEDNVIESRPRYPDGHKGGVRIHALKKRLEEIIATRKPVNEYDKDTGGKKRFVIRRFL